LSPEHKKQSKLSHLCLGMPKAEVSATLEPASIPFSPARAEETIGTYNWLNLDPNAVPQISHATEMQERLYVSEMLLKKLYVQNQDLSEKLEKAQGKIKTMDTDYRVLQKQHLLLQHNVHNKIIGKIFCMIFFLATRLSNVSQKTLGFKDKESARRNSFDKFLETQGLHDEISSFWDEIHQNTNNYMNTESIDDELAKKISNVFQSQSILPKKLIEAEDTRMRKDTEYDKC